MNKRKILASLNKIANELDNNRLYEEANSLTYIMVKLAQKQPSNIKTFYHGTTTGENDKILKSFLQGINPTLAKGFGQGQGFYVLKSQEDAKEHAKLLLSDNREFKKQIENMGGIPMVIKVTLPLNSENFDFDYENRYGTAARIIDEMWDEFKQIPDGELIDTENEDKGIIVKINPSESQRKMSKNGIAILTIIGYDNKNQKKENLIYAGKHPSGPVEKAKLMNTILSRLQKINPQKFKELEDKYLNLAYNNQDMSSLKGFTYEETSDVSLALKYNYPQGLLVYPEDIEVFYDNNWIDANTYLNMKENLNSNQEAEIVTSLKNIIKQLYKNGLYKEANTITNIIVKI